MKHGKRNPQFVLGPEIYRRAVETAPNAIVMVDKEGKIVLVNAQTEALFGYPRNDLIGQKVEALIPRRFQSRYAAYRSDFLADPKTRAMGAGRDLFGLKKNGDEVPIEIGLNPITTTEGTFVLASIIDITERKREEAKIRRLATVTTDSNDAITVQDFEGKITAWNRGAERMYGYAEAEALAMNIRDTVPKEKRAEAIAFVEKLKEEEAPSFETQRLTKDGRTLDVWLTVTKLVDEAGKPAGIATTERDITERKKLEQEISDRNRELETLLHVTSHDLKEPLRAIENFSEMIAQEHTAGLDPEGKDLFHRVSKASQRLGGLLDDILTLSRARRLEKPAASIDGQALVNEALSRLEEKVRETRATVRVVGKFPSLYVDKTWAVEAVYNLLSNALKFKKDDQPPEVEIAPYHPQARPNLRVAKGQPREVGGQAGDPPGVGFVVRDRGPGVAPEYAEKIFELFQRAVGREVEGTGAGLAIVREVARRHGGKAWVRPREGGGSEFTITFGG